jgi:hypothetical protein
MLDLHVKEMKALAKRLAKYSFPTVSPKDELDISCLKQREITVDGYELIVYFNECRHKDEEMQTVQVFGRYFTFLPFSVVCKVASLFLGTKNLSLVETMQAERKIYVWSVHRKDGELKCSPVDTLAVRKYDGLEFAQIDHKQVRFF